jgi:hypothetical protein
VFFLAGLLTLSLPFAAHYAGSPKQKFVVCFLILNVFGFLNGCVQGQVFGLGGILPGKYMGSIMFGNGLSGIACNVLRMILNATMDAGSLYPQALIFFILSALVLFGCSWAYTILQNNEFYNYYKNVSSNKDQRTEVDLRAS